MQHSHTTPCTYDDYLLLPDDGKRYEIIDGELFVAPAPFIDHQRISIFLTNIIFEYVSEMKIGEVFTAPGDVVFSMIDIVQPDIVYVSASRKEIITKRNIIAAPDFVVEILSLSTVLADRTTKKSLYEKYGVKEYWIVDPEEETIEVFNL
ncbi:MAG: Uma2 family endonuclease, partial [Bacteroidetes bacterium]